MQRLAMALFGLAAVLTLILWPNRFPVMPLLLLSLLRAVVLALALLFWIASGRLDGWGRTRGVPALTAVMGVAALTGGCLLIQMTRDDRVPLWVAWAYRIGAGLLPVVFLFAVIRASRRVLIGVSVVAPVCGLVAMLSWGRATQVYVDGLPESREIRAREAMQVAELEAIPLSQSPEGLVRYIHPGAYPEVMRRAQAQLDAAPDGRVRVAALLDGADPLGPLYVLTRDPDRLTDGIALQCWRAAARMAKGAVPAWKKGAPAPELAPRMLLDAVVALGNRSASERQRHGAELAAVRAFLGEVEPGANASPLDLWVRQSELRRVSPGAGLVPLLEFAGPGEAYETRKEALARMEQIPGLTARLLRLLDGPHRLDALVVLAERADRLTPGEREACWQAAAVAGRGMAHPQAGAAHPTAAEIRKLSGVASQLWARLDSDPAGRKADLAVIRTVVRSGGDAYEQAALAWADGVLATEVR